MEGVLASQPTPARPWPALELYVRASVGWAEPRASGSVIGTVNVATPVDSCVEKLSPMP